MPDFDPTRTVGLAPNDDSLVSFPDENPASPRLLHVTSADAAAELPRALSDASSPPVVHERWPKPRPATQAPVHSSTVNSTDVPRTGDALHLTIAELRVLGSQLVRAYARLEDQQQRLDTRGQGALDTLASVERRLASVETLRDLTLATDARFAEVSRLAEDISQREALLHGQDEAVGRLEARASVAVELLERRFADCRARIDELSDPEQPLAAAETAVGQVVLRANATTNLVARQTAEVQALEQRIDAAHRRLSELGATTDALSARVGDLVSQEAAIARAREVIEQLEQQANLASAQLNRVTAAHTSLERAVADAHHHVRQVTTSAHRQALLVTLRHKARTFADATSRAVARLSHDGGTQGRWAWRSMRAGGWDMTWAAGLGGAMAVILLLAWFVGGGRQAGAGVSAERVPTAGADTLVSAVRRASDIALPEGRSRASAGRAKPQASPARKTTRRR